MKRFLKIGVSIVIIIILIASGGMFYITRGLDEGSNVKVNAVNTSSISDGTYSGKYNAGRWSNEIKVTVKDHKITKIDIVKDVTFPKPEWSNELFNKVIKKQNTDIDVLSGATITSKAYLKSIENALKEQ